MIHDLDEGMPLYIPSKELWIGHNYINTEKENNNTSEHYKKRPIKIKRLLPKFKSAH